MCRPNFRVKLDLCKFYNDVRRYCWIFIDGTKMCNVSHMTEHIGKLLNIKEPFHLLLNKTEYLPPNEDIRIVKENETILVSPGSGLENEMEISTENTTQDMSSFMKEERNNSFQHKEIQTNCFSVNTTAVQTLSNEGAYKSQSEFSGFSTACYGKGDSEASSVIESKTTDTALMEDFNTENLYPKRKRVRHRKKKTKEVEQSTPQENENKPAKPRIIDSCPVSFGKHIRFDNVDSKDVKENKVIRTDTMNGCNVKQISPSHELANLLSLGKSSTPLTFSNTRVKEEPKVEHMSDVEPQVNASSENRNESVAVNEKAQNGKKDWLDKDFLKCPILTRKPELLDVIAFKMLKIGSDYTPQISDFIVGEVIFRNPLNTVYTFKVLKGLSEVQIPLGKFTIIQDKEERVMNDTFVVNYAQMMESRLISSGSPPVSMHSIK
ncbi:uncharacterized protein LOC114873959 [Osmia bicornis bicornis]|uniref:uncharacterized protein LOC114873959 n=1 Tax=Osmia bicornis bicornis TaxID=1437191 RepID=UPI001EAF0211|nr:uncharacterized protein LOC114873959 [Osmia bicornis bicornis]